jgi:hypothetical protein
MSTIGGELIEELKVPAEDDGDDIKVPLAKAPLAVAGQGRNHNGADRLCDRGRSGQGWPRRKP